MTQKEFPVILMIENPVGQGLCSWRFLEIAFICYERHEQSPCPTISDIICGFNQLQQNL